ncbi:MAG: SIS domain-containing protein [Candidatus Latescibacteria bacterium]|nr:SIS domain-containing protein [Candidatus Latescibacterota bacterium]
MGHTESFLRDATQAIAQLDQAAIERMVALFIHTRQQDGRLFILGVGGSAANASHAVNDFRKLAGMEAYAPTDNVSELTARINDEGWDTAFAKWLEGSRLSARDLILVLSVGGGNQEKQISVNLVRALEYAAQVGASICGIVGRDGGYTAQVARVCVIVPTISAHTLTPLAESFQALVWHLIVSHPDLQVAAAKWESMPTSS